MGKVLTWWWACGIGLSGLRSRRCACDGLKREVHKGILSAKVSGTRQTFIKLTNPVLLQTFPSLDARGNQPSCSRISLRTLRNHQSLRRGTATSSPETLPFGAGPPLQQKQMACLGLLASCPVQFYPYWDTRVRALNGWFPAATQLPVMNCGKCCRGTVLMPPLVTPSPTRHEDFDPPSRLRNNVSGSADCPSKEAFKNSFEFGGSLPPLCHNVEVLTQKHPRSEAVSLRPLASHSHTLPVN